MNLQQFQSALPKPWLDIQCNKLTCNEIVVSVQPSNLQLFACYQSVSSPLLPVTTTLCDTVQIANPNLNIVANTYTAPSTQYVQVTVQGSTGAGVGGAGIATTITLTVDGVALPSPLTTLSVTVSPFNSVSLTCTGIVRLNAGQVLGYVVNNSLAVGLFNQNYAFSGIVV